MGKAQTKKKTQGWRHNPVRVPDAHLGAGKGEGKANPAKAEQMLPVLKKLGSTEYADRIWACAAISNLIQNDAATRRLFQGNNVVGALIERLTDDVDEVVVEASGALRNLAIDGGRELCGEMANKGIISHLAVLIGKITTTVDQIMTSTVPDTDESYQARKHLLSLSENVISLLWCLAEAGPKSLASVNGLSCEILLVKILEGREKLGLGVSAAAAQTLFALSQDNFPFRKSLIVHPTALPILISDSAAQGAEDDLPDGRALLRRVHVCGVLRNIIRAGSRADEKVGINELTGSTILPLVNGLLDVKLGDVCERVSQLVQQIPPPTETLSSNSPQTDHKTSTDVALERIERNLSTVVAALEVLTNICAGLEDAEEVAAEIAEEGGAAEVVEDDEDADMDDDEVDDEGLISRAREPGAEVEMEAAGVVINPGATLSHLLKALNLPERLTALSQPLALSFPPATSEPSLHPPTTAVLSVLHLHALEALNNLLLTAVASIDNADGPKAVASIREKVPAQGLWDSMFGIVCAVGGDQGILNKKGQEMRMEIMQMALGGLWGAVKVNSEVVNVQQDQVQALMDIIPLLRDESSKSRAIEILSSLASRSSTSPSENTLISSHLISLLPSASSPELLISLLNAIIDIYSDETRSYDAVFEQQAYAQVLAGLVGKVRAEVKKVDKRKDAELRVRGEEVYENLVAFIKWRRSLK
ncbi:hypothetical protein L198_08196 [Cryptococcus wingfieldii CBS 7118]|uniref:SYO1-like TPR repeats domain-containing protein n=1 Tax=Cryptococcus wingfieldii CBS 7118 TaxID=1295528 RepID=A0A1E3HFP4_9TREE|nr:hypothetical protein L198_08196 [Cryptococcus wingfieldii CBS 7118]ODN74945.1 hypothetical protein L198_08196 [Cryptococcus wingfieldii CBS 7118]